MAENKVMLAVIVGALLGAFWSSENAEEQTPKGSARFARSVEKVIF